MALSSCFPDRVGRQVSKVDQAPGSVRSHGGNEDQRPMEDAGVWVCRWEREQGQCPRGDIQGARRRHRQAGRQAGRQR